jgi:hypothetical protein
MDKKRTTTKKHTKTKKMETLNTKEQSEVQIFEKNLKRKISQNEDLKKEKKSKMKETPEKEPQFEIALKMKKPKKNFEMKENDSPEILNHSKDKTDFSSKNKQITFAERMMFKMGWNEKKGLGKYSDGITDYIKVVKKNDKLGIGVPKNPHVTKEKLFQRIVGEVYRQRKSISFSKKKKKISGTRKKTRMRVQRMLEKIKKTENSEIKFDEMLV